MVLKVALFRYVKSYQVDSVWQVLLGLSWIQKGTFWAVRGSGKSRRWPHIPEKCWCPEPESFPAVWRKLDAKFAFSNPEGDNFRSSWNFLEAQNSPQPPKCSPESCPWFFRHSRFVFIYFLQPDCLSFFRQMKVVHAFLRQNNWSKFEFTEIQYDLKCQICHFQSLKINGLK